MENDTNIPSHEKRRLVVSVDEDDALARVLEINQGDYECVMVNQDWPEKNLFEGDIILFTAATAGGAGDIVLIEEDGRSRLGLIAEPGYLETPNGWRPIKAQERIIGVGVGLARRLPQSSRIDGDTVAR
jgi:hypothetical protein